MASVDRGATHLELAGVLPRERRCALATHSPGVAASFEVHTGLDVILIGGRMFRRSMADLSALVTVGARPDWLPGSVRHVST